MPKQFQINAALWQVPTNVGATDRQVNVNNAVAHLTIERRCDFVEELVDQFVMHLPDPPEGAEVVNIFALPEYYFASSATDHYLDEHTKNQIVERLKTISRIGNTVLIAGTVPWIKPFTRPGEKMIDVRTSRYNRAIKRYKKDTKTFGGGPASVPGSTVRSPREYLESQKRAKNLDNCYFAENTAFIARSGEIIKKYHKRRDGGETNVNDIAEDRIVFFIPGNTNGNFKVDGMSLGIEICAEHNGGVLQRTVAQELDVHVVISAHMAIQPDAFGRARVNGYLFHADSTDAPTVHQNANPYRLIDAQSSSAKTPLSNEAILGRLDAYDDNLSNYRIPLTPQVQLKMLNSALTILNGRLNTYTLPLTI